MANTPRHDSLSLSTVQPASLSGAAHARSGIFSARSLSIPSAPDLDAASDSGTSSTDDITSVATPVFTGTGDAGDTVALFDTDGTTMLGSVVVDGSGKWSITSTSLSEGSHTVIARSGDGNGTFGADSTALTVTIDTTAPATPSTPDMAAGSDSGIFSFDNYTNITTPLFNGTGEIGSTVTLYDNSNSGAVLGSVTVNGAGKWSITSTTLSEGTHVLTTKASDTAGNFSTASSSLSVTIDTTVPASTPDAPTIVSAEDSGVSNSDGITNFSTPLLSGNGAVKNQWVNLYEGTTLIDIIQADGQGHYEYTLSLPEGVHTLTVKSVDLAGNIGTASAPFTLTIDTAAPSAPDAPDLVDASDSGTSNSDDITSTTTPVFSGTAEANAAITLYDTDGSTVLGTTTAAGDGKWSITSTTLSENVHTVSVTATDLAGNVSVASNTLSVTIDTTAPTTTVASVSFSNDTGPSSSDFTTKTAAQTLSGTLNAGLGADELVQVSLDNGSTWTTATATASNTNWSLAGQTLTASDTLKVRVSDLAGNTSSPLSKAYVLDTTAPALASAITISDTALKIGDTATVTFTFTEAVNGFTTADVAVPNGKLSALSSSDGGTTWTATLTPTASTTASTNVLTLDNTGYADKAGNAGTSSTTSLNYAVDTVRPSLASTITVSDTALKIGDTATVTFTFTEAVSGFTTADLTAPNGSLKNLSSSDGGTTWTATLTPTASTTAASNVITLDTTGIVDAAGNAGTGSETSGNYAVDTVAPTFNAAGSTPADNAASVSRTGDLVAAFSEPLDASSDLTKVYLKTVVGGTLVPATVTLNGSGQLVIHPTAALDFATAYAVNWDAGALKDAAGNTAAAVGDLTTYNFTTQAAPPSEPAEPTDTDGVSDAVENAAPALPNPNGGAPVAGDGNGDGVPDGQQNNVTSLPFLTTTTPQSAPGNASKVYVTLVADSLNGKVDTHASNGAQLKNVVQMDAAKDLPANLSTPLGQIAFSAAVQPGATEKFSLYVDGSVAINGYFKKDASGQWVNLASAAYGGKVVTEGGKTRLDFTITDGGAFDADGRADGVITDPGSPGKLTAAACPYDPFRLDTDRDGIPDAVESAAGMNAAVKDNNVFGNNRLFVNQLYRDLLSREGAGDAGAQYWAARIDNGTASKTQVFDALLNSPEFDSHAAAIIRLYHAVLGRSPDLCGYNYWMDQVNNGATGQQLGNAFLSSAEFLGSNAGLTDSAFVDLIYQNLLKRTADTAGKAYWVSQLQTGAQDRGTMLFNVAQSAEFKATMKDAVAVDTLGLGLLDRGFSAVEFAYWDSQYSQYASTTQFLQATTAATTEYHDRFVPADSTTHAVADAVLVGVAT